MRSITAIQLSDFYKEKNNNYVFVDVRTPAEFKSEHIPFFINIPLPKVEEFTKTLKKDQVLVLSCLSGMRSAKAMKILHDKVDTIMHVKGGLQAWKQAAFETIKQPSSMISIMRQVQLIIGVSSLLGIILAVLVNPLFLWIPVFFSSGLIFAGLSNTCGLAILLGYMPWNR